MTLFTSHIRKAVPFGAESIQPAQQRKITLKDTETKNMANEFKDSAEAAEHLDKIDDLLNDPRLKHLAKEAENDCGGDPYQAFKATLYAFMDLKEGLNHV